MVAPPSPAPTVDTGAALRLLRLAFGLSQADVARRAGIKRQRIALYESYRQQVQYVNKIEAIARVFGLTAADFIAIAELIGRGDVA